MAKKLVSIPPLVIEPHMQKHAADCVVSALAMYLGVPYRLVSEVVSLLDFNTRRGLDWAQAQQIASHLGAAIKTVIVRDLERIRDRTGILSVEWVYRKKPAAHAVVLFQGVIINPADGLVYDLDTFLSYKKCRVTSMLVAEGDPE